MNPETPPPPTTIFPETEVDLKKPRPPAELVELAVPRTAAEAFSYLAVRAAELAVELKTRLDKGEKLPNGIDEMWAVVSETVRDLGAFAAPLTYANARHVRWAYQTVLRRVPQSRMETEPLLSFLRQVPACANEKAAPAALLFFQLARFCVAHAESFPVPHRVKGKPQLVVDTGAPPPADGWAYEKDGLTVFVSNEDAYQMQQKRFFWGRYSQQLLRVVEVLLREICGVPEPKPVVKVVEAAAPPTACSEGEPAKDSLSPEERAKIEARNEGRPEYKWGDVPPPEHIAKGWGCRKWNGVAGCWCRVGYPPAEQHEACRGAELRNSRCECPPAAESAPAQDGVQVVGSVEELVQTIIEDARPEEPTPASTPD